MKKILLGLGAASLTILPIAAMVSCSSTPINTQLNAQKFEVSQPIKASGTKAATTENVIDPEFNNGAKEIVNRLFNSLTVEGLQRDFNLILTDFFDIYEFEQGDTEIELVDNGITVKSIGAADGQGIRTATLLVKYEVETETKDTTQVKEKEISWKIKPMVSSHAQIEQIKKLILGSTTTNSGIDIKDLKEYFLGEKDQDDLDDIGVFDRIAQLNKKDNLNNLGGLVGYEVKLSDIFNQLGAKPKAAVTLDTVFFAPSASLNNTFLIPSQTGSLDYQFDENVLKGLDKSTVVGYTTAEQLGTILVKNQKNTDGIKLVKGITVEEVGPLLKLTVNFTNVDTPSEVISINPILLKPAVTTPPTPTPNPSTL